MFTGDDRAGAPPVAIINQDFGEPVRQVVGIVADVREDASNIDPWPAVFVPAAQRSVPLGSGPRSVWKMWAVVRTRVPSGSLASAIEQELRQSTGLPVPPLRSMEKIVARSTGSRDRHPHGIGRKAGGCTEHDVSQGMYRL